MQKDKKCTRERKKSEQTKEKHRMSKRGSVL